MDKRGHEPGTPGEVAAQLLRVARQQGSARRLLNRRGRLDENRLNDIRQAADELAATGAIVTHVIKAGFPAATPHEQAIDDALQTARQHGRPITAEILTSPEHQAAGEYLVRVLVIDGNPGRARIDL